MGFTTPTDDELEERFGRSYSFPGVAWLPRGARGIRDYVPPGREQALALTKLEEAMMWAIAGIERAHRGDGDD